MNTTNYLRRSKWSNLCDVKLYIYTQCTLLQSFKCFQIPPSIRLNQLTCSTGLVLLKKKTCFKGAIVSKLAGCLNRIFNRILYLSYIYNVYPYIRSNPFTMIAQVKTFKVNRTSSIHVKPWTTVFQ